MKEASQEAALSLWRLPVVQRTTGLSRSTVLEMVRVGKFPKPIRSSTRCVAWLSSEVKSWIAERIAASRKATA